MYFLNSWSQRHKLNASFAPVNGHFSLPLIGGTEMNFSSNTGLSNFIYPLDDGFVTFMHSSVDGQKFINALDPDLYFNQGMTINLLSFGVKTQRGFWSFDCSLKENMNINVPKDFFRLIKLGFEHSINQFDLKSLSINQANYSEIAVGYSTEINSKLRIGANVKILSGLSSEKIDYSKFDVTLSNNKYEVSTEGELLIMSNNLTIGTDQNNSYDLTKYKLNIFGKSPAGFGTAIDLGATYKLNEKITLAAAINDLGFISWAASSIQKGKATSNIEFSGFSNINSDSINIAGQLNQLKEDAKKLFLFEKQSQTTKNFLQSVPCTINVSGEYLVTGNKNQNVRIGMLFNSYNSTDYHSNELITAITLKPISWLSASATYSLFRKDSNRFGFALNLSPRWINIFLASDFITTKLNRQFLPINKFNLNFQAGLSFYLGD
jgi:hypothetical protein